MSEIKYKKQFKCINLGFVLCNGCVDSYLQLSCAPDYGICAAEYIYDQMHYHKWESDRKRLIKNWVLEDGVKLKYLIPILNKFYPEYLEHANKFLVLK